MSAVEQYRAGFEAWWTSPTTTTAAPYTFMDGQTARATWAAAKREASTEPSAALVDCLKCEGRGKHAKFDGTTLFDGACAQCGGKGRVLAGALTDDAKDAAIETMDHDQLSKLGQHYANGK